MRLQEEKYLQATAPTRVEIIREQIQGPTTHIHPTIANPDHSDTIAQVGELVAGMHRSLSEHATRQAGDMQSSMKSWPREAHSIWGRPTVTPEAPSYVPGQASSSGLDRSTKNTVQRATRSAEAHTSHSTTGHERRARSRSPQRAGESSGAVATAAKQNTTPARVVKPKAMAIFKPHGRYGPQVGSFMDHRGKHPAPAPTPPPPPPPPPPPAAAPKKRKDRTPSPERPAPRPKAKARAKAMAASLPEALRRRPDDLPVRQESAPKRARIGLAPELESEPAPRRKPRAKPRAKARGRPFAIAAL